MTFLNPLFLLGIALAAIPIIIHLWFQKKLRRIPFSTLKFLKISEAKRIGWLKFREVLILALRCLFIAFLFLALAKPMLENRILKTGRLASVFLIIDNTYSMAYGENFELAKDMVTQLISCYSQNSEFCVLPLCGMSKTNSPSWLTKKSVSRLVNKIELSYKGCSINDLLSCMSKCEPRYQVEYVYIGDGQEINFKDFKRNLIKDTKFYWIKIPTGSNAAITKVFIKDPIEVPLDDYILSVRLTNFSSNMWSGKASINSGDYYFEQECEIQPNQSKDLEILLPISINRGEVKIFDDSLLIDNVYFFSKTLPKRLNVLILGKDEFLRLGLAPGTGFRKPFYVESVSNLGIADLRKFDVVIINGLYEISASDKMRLGNFLHREDTGVICLLGDEVGENLRDLVSECGDIGDMISPRGYTTLDWIDYEHQVFKVFVGSPALKNIKFYRFQEIIAEKEVIARLNGNYPFVVIRDNLAVVATQFTPQTTDIMYKSTFVPLLYRLIGSIVFRFPNKEFFIGEKTNFDKLKAPTGEYLTKGSEFLIPGFYATRDETLGVNVMPDEGNLNILGSERASILGIEVINLEKGFAGSDLSGIFLYLALFVIILELMLLLIR